MAPRRGLSLTEVLIAIFVMAIGMISLLALFPLGMINMAWALKNNRMSQACASANSMGDVPNAAVLWNSQTGQVATARFNVRDDIDYNFIELSAGYPLIWNSLSSSQPPPTWTATASNPDTKMVVYVDPIGRDALGPGATVGGINPNTNFPVNFGANGTLQQVGVPRVSMFQAMYNTGTGWASNSVMARALCSQDDDVGFNPDGSATVDPASPRLERGRRFSWGYVCRWPRFSDKSVVEMSVPIYSGRGTPLPVGSGNQTTLSTEPAFLGGGGFQTPANPPVWWNSGNAKDQLAFLQGSSTATVLLPQQSPGAPLTIRKGDWLFDNTLLVPNPANQNAVIPFANGFFYKVLGLSDPYQNSTGRWVQDLQLDRPAKDYGWAVVLLQAVGDVKEKSDGRMPVK